MRTSKGWLLGIHTTTPSLGLALLDLSNHADHPCWFQAWPLAREMAGQLHSCLADFMGSLPWSDLVAIGVAAGPGSFTGSRLGVTVARTLGQTLEIPVFGISTLAAVAYAYGSQQVSAGAVDHPLDLWVEFDAQRGDWVAGQYQFDPHTQQLTCLETDRFWAGSEWAEQKAKMEGICVAEGHFQDPPPTEAVACLAAQHWQVQPDSPWYTLEPIYGRQPPIHS